MSDGPYKSLPLPRCWKKLAKYLENESYSKNEIDSACSYALSLGFKEIPIEQAKNILNNSNLFPEIVIHDLEKLKSQHIGSNVGRDFIDNIEMLSNENINVRDILACALNITLRMQLNSCSRSIVEHYLRKDQNNQYKIQEKLTDLNKRFSCKNMIDEFLNKGKIEKNMKKHRDIEDGPSL